VTAFRFVAFFGFAADDACFACDDGGVVDELAFCGAAAPAGEGDEAAAPLAMPRSIKPNVRDNAVLVYLMVM
jgi:hypothetical protein